MDSKRGRAFQFSDTAIEITLMIKGRFCRPLHALQALSQYLY